LQTILRNLLNNAIKYSHQNSFAEVKAEEKDDKVVVSIKDDGVGMDEKTQNVVFNLVGSSSKAGTKDEHGSGLGLALCKELVEKQGEKIWFESAPGKGSIFYFSLKNRAMTTT
jgi:signal transduction histidine kinase